MHKFDKLEISNIYCRKRFCNLYTFGTTITLYCIVNFQVKRSLVDLIMREHEK